MISVIIPMYNVEKYIIKCLLSFENQIYRDFEILIINDGSTDNSLKVVKDYMEKSNLNIRLLNQVNQGVSAARNNGISVTKGEYLCFVDPDDMITDYYLQYLIDAIESNDKCDIAICKIKEIDDAEASNYGSKTENLQYDIKNSITVLRLMLYHKINKVGIWALLVKKDLLIDNGIKFTVGCRYGEDAEVVWKALASATNVALIHNRLYLYRIRIGSAMYFVDNRRKDVYYIYKRLEKYFENNKPNFSVEFNKYGVAYCAWSSAWQGADKIENVRKFEKYTNDFHMVSNMKKLSHFPNIKVRFSAKVYLISPVLFYYLIKIYLLSTKFKRRN